MVQPGDFSTRQQDSSRERSWEWNSQGRAILEERGEVQEVG